MIDFLAPLQGEPICRVILKPKRQSVARPCDVRQLDLMEMPH